MSDHETIIVETSGRVGVINTEPTQGAERPEHRSDE